jgi:hypothetical protein
MTWTELSNTLLDFDIEIEKVAPVSRIDRAGKEHLVLLVSFADKASNYSLDLEF